MDILNILLDISIFSGMLFFATMLIKKSFKNKMSPFLHYAVWALFILRLMIPVTLEAPIHVMTYPAQTLPATEQYESPAYTDTTFNNATLSDTAVEEQATNYHTENSTIQENTQSITSNTTAAAMAHTVRLTARQIMLLVWLSGIAVGAFYVAVLAFVLFRKTRRNSAPASAHLKKLLNEVKNEFGIKSKLKLVCQYEYGSPALLFPHTILIPMNVLASMNDEQIKNCLRHECMHYKRFDNVMSLLLTLLNVVYWFNPFMWLASREIRKDMETACDSAVVKRFHASARRDYAVLILELSAHSRFMQLALGMAQRRKSAERRIRGVFMERKSKLSVKLVSVILSAVMLVCCFTTACQPSADIAAAVSDTGSLSKDMIEEPLPQGALKEVDAPVHWEETLYRQNERIFINADVDVLIPESFSNTPVLELEQVPLTQERLTELTQYFVGNSKLYKPLPMTKLEGSAQLEKIIDGEGSFGFFVEEGRRDMAHKLQKMIDEAPESAEKVYTDLNFTIPYKTDYTTVLEGYVGDLSKPQIENFVDVFAETGEEYEPMISASTYDSAAGVTSRFAFTYPGDIISVSDMVSKKQDTAFIISHFSGIIEKPKVFESAFNQYHSAFNQVVDNMTQTPEQALTTAVKAFDDLGINDLNLNKVEKGAWMPRQLQVWDEFSTDISKIQGGYSFTFTRSAGQLSGINTNYNGTETQDILSYTPPYRVETLYIFVSNGKIIQFDWRNMSQICQTVAQNTKFLPFDQITDCLADYFAIIYPAYEGQYANFLNGPNIEITSVELRSSQISAENDAFKAWLVPSWLFRFKTSYTDFSGEDLSESFLCEINALDGGIIIPHKIRY